MSQYVRPRNTSLQPHEWSAAVRDDVAFALDQDEVDALIDHDLPRMSDRTSGNARYTLGIFEFVVRKTVPDLFESSLRDQIVPAVLRELHAHLSLTNNGQSIADHFGRLLSVARRLRPEIDIEPILIERSLVDIPSRKKIVPELSTREVWDAGQHLMASARKRHDRRVRPDHRQSFDSATGCRFRDGLMIAFAAVCMPRTANLAIMRIDVHYTQGVVVDRLHFAASETKPRNDLSRQIPGFLKDAFDTYLRTFRPLIRGAKNHNWLWPSPLGGAYAYGSIQACFKRRLPTPSGKGMRVHDCRRAGGNSTVVCGDLDVTDAQSALAHVDLTTTEIYISLESDRAVGIVSELYKI